ncbi:MAG: DUF720 domain-containing protein [Chlamydiia bacterium]|nr:DUF720 domain-containing protein [Chlamydiia bacterium]
MGAKDAIQSINNEKPSQNNQSRFDIQFQNHEAVETKKNERGNPQGGADQMDAIYMAYFLILQSVNLQNDTAAIQAKSLQVNAIEQVQLNQEQEKIQYVTIPANLKGEALNEQIPKFQAQNQEIEAERQGISNNLLLLRQNAQVGETKIDTSVNNVEQSVQEGAGLLHMLVNISNQITR